MTSGSIKQPSLGHGLTVNTLITSMKMVDGVAAVKGQIYNVAFSQIGAGRVYTDAEGGAGFAGGLMRLTAPAKDAQGGWWGIALEDIAAGGSGKFMFRGIKGDPSNWATDPGAVNGDGDDPNGVAYASTGGDNWFPGDNFYAGNAGALVNNQETAGTGDQKLIGRIMKEITLTGTTGFAPMLFNGIEGFGTAG